MESVSSGLKAGKERPATDIVLATEYPRSRCSKVNILLVVITSNGKILFGQGHVGGSDNVRSANPFR